MTEKLVLIAVLFLTACSQIGSPHEDRVVGARSDSATNTTGNEKPIPENVKSSENAESTLNCDDLLISFVNKSSFDPEIKKFKFKVWVDEFLDSAAILKITLKNEERNQDMVISWLKLDIKKDKLFDITSDPDNPKELMYDTVVYKKIITHCRFVSTEE